jgi:hypothetical protein
MFNISLIINYSRHYQESGSFLAPGYIIVLMNTANQATVKSSGFYVGRVSRYLFSIKKKGLHNRRFPETYRISLGVLDNRRESNGFYLLHRHDDFST